jgi:transcriptional regulator of acetoin/glycerol metabolism
LITALRIRGTEYEYVMLAGRPKFGLGTSPHCEICVERRHVSHSHALLERREHRIRVTDLASKNGVVFRGRKESQFDIGAGDTFSIDETVFYALNDEMRLARPVVSEILGAQRMEDIDDVVMTAVLGSHMLLLAEPGSDQERIARAVHSASLRRRHHFVIARPTDGALDPQLVEHARNGTLLLMPGPASLDPRFVEAVLRPELNVRAIICATSLKSAIDSVTEDLAGRAYKVRIAPVRERRGEIAGLLERWFIDRQARLRFSDLTDENQAALRGYRWPENLEELREVAYLLVQLAPFASERKAAMEVNIPRTTVKRWLDTIGLALPLVREPSNP